MVNIPLFNVIYSVSYIPGGAGFPAINSKIPFLMDCRRLEIAPMRSLVVISLIIVVSP